MPNITSCKYPFLELAKAIFTSFSKISISLIATLLILEEVLFVFNNLLKVILCVAINLTNPIKSGKTTSAPSFSNIFATKLLPNGWYLIKTSPTIPTLGFSTDVSSSIFQNHLQYHKYFV